MSLFSQELSDSFRVEGENKIEILMKNIVCFFQPEDHLVKTDSFFKNYQIKNSFSHQ
jgi:hypothetical protein